MLLQTPYRERVIVNGFHNEHKKEARESVLVCCYQVAPFFMPFVLWHITRIHWKQCVCQRATANLGIFQ